MSELFDDENYKARYRERFEEGFAIGNARSIVKTIPVIMTNTKCSLEEALRLAGLTMEDYEQSLVLLVSKNKYHLRED